MSGYIKAAPASSKLSSSSKKLKVAYQKDDLRPIVEKAIETDVSAYEEIKSMKLICDPIAEYI